MSFAAVQSYIFAFSGLTAGYYLLDAVLSILEFYDGSNASSIPNLRYSIKKKGYFSITLLAISATL